MRQVTAQAAAAFNSGLPFGKSNTSVIVDEFKTKLTLFGHTIAHKLKPLSNDSNDNITGVIITNAGYFTNTTKERLNGLSNVSVNQSKGEWFLNGLLWNGENTLIPDDGTEWSYY